MGIKVETNEEKGIFAHKIVDSFKSLLQDDKVCSPIFPASDDQMMFAIFIRELLGELFVDGELAATDCNSCCCGCCCCC